MLEFNKAMRKMMAVALTCSFLLPATLLAEDHVAPLSELQKSMVKASEIRQANVSTVQKFFSSDSAKKALKRAGINSTKVVKAVPALSDDELARLADRASRAQQDFAAGALSNQELTYVVIALAAALLVIIIVVA